MQKLTTILLLALSFSLHGQNDVFDRAFRAGIGAQAGLKNVRAEAGFYYAVDGTYRIYAKSMIRLADLDFMDIFISPFWLDYDLEKQRYQTPISLEFWFVENRWFRLIGQTDFYANTYRPSVALYITPWKYQEHGK